jgi:hypothetical protein
MLLISVILIIEYHIDIVKCLLYLQAKKKLKLVELFNEKTL